MCLRSRFFLVNRSVDVVFWAEVEAVEAGRSTSSSVAVIVHVAVAGAFLVLIGPGAFKLAGML